MSKLIALFLASSVVVAACGNSAAEESTTSAAPERTTITAAPTDIDIHDAWCAGWGYGFASVGDQTSVENDLERLMKVCYLNQPPATSAFDAFCLGNASGRLAYNGDDEAAKQDLDECLATIHEDTEQQELLETGTDLLAEDLDTFLESLVEFVNS